MDIKPKDLVTVQLDQDVSNTYIVYKVIDGEALLHHPLSPEVYIIRDVEQLNKVAPNIKDSTERALDFAFHYSKYLDYNNLADLEALSLFYVVRKKLTPKQKNILSVMCGMIACILMDNDIAKVSAYIKENHALFDDFNRMWYNNFQGLFSGKQPITSKKQRASIFNMAGFLMAELMNQTVKRD